MPLKKRLISSSTPQTRNKMVKRALETTDHRDVRLETDRQLHARYGRITYIDLNLSAFHYDVNYNYSIHPRVVIGKMDKSCIYRTAFKFKNEASDTYELCWRKSEIARITKTKLNIVVILVLNLF